MASFFFDSSAKLAELVVPCDESNAEEIVSTALANADGWVSAAFYYKTKAGKPANCVLYITMNDDQPGGFCNIMDYHPRKDGKAALIYKTDVILNW